MNRRAHGRPSGGSNQSPFQGMRQIVDDERHWKGIERERN